MTFPCHLSTLYLFSMPHNDMDFGQVRVMEFPWHLLRKWWDFPCEFGLIPEPNQTAVKNIWENPCHILYRVFNTYQLPFPRIMPMAFHSPQESPASGKIPSWNSSYLVSSSVDNHLKDRSIQLNVEPDVHPIPGSVGSSNPMIMLNYMKIVQKHKRKKDLLYLRYLMKNEKGEKKRESLHTEFIHGRFQNT